MTSASLIAACSSSGSSGGGASDYSNVTFTTIGYTTVITPGAPMNPFNATNNVFPTFDAMQLGWNAGNSADPGCLVEPRCPFAEPDCRDEPPPLVSLDGSAPGQAQAHACLHPARRSVVPVSAVPGTAPEDPERSVLPADPHPEPGAGLA